MLATLAARLLSEWIIARPLTRVVKHAQRIGSGDLTASLQVRGAKEIASLKEALNGMCEQLRQARATAKAESAARLAALEQLRHADRLRTVGTLASGIAHELGTPLNVILLRAKMVGKVLPAASESVAVIVSQTEKMTTIVRQLLDFARRKAPHRVARDVSELAESAVRLLMPLARKASVDLHLDDLPNAAMAEVDAAQVEQALTNLVVNAVHASAPGGIVFVRAETVEEDVDGALRSLCRLTVTDEGAGIKDEDMERIFEPFFATKDVGQGTGLGLAAAMADTLQAGLEAHGHVVTATSTGDGALAALDAEPFDVVVTDVRMRGASGIDLCRRVVGNRPDLPVIVMTAFGTMETAVASMRAGAFDMLTTPFEIDELGFAVARALQHCALRELGQHFVARSAARNRKAVTQLSPAVAEIGCSPTPGRATSASSRPARRGRPATQGEGLPGEPRGPRHRGSDGARHSRGAGGELCPEGLRCGRRQQAPRGSRSRC